MPANTGHPYNAAIDSNKHPSLTVVSGTAGTADTSGTAEQFRVGGNPTTGAIYTQSVGASAADPTSGTLNTIGTIGTVIGVGTVTNLGALTTVSSLTNGSINILTGTVTSVTAVGGLVTGTITTGSISNIAMVHAGTHVHPTGTITTIAAGTQNTLGTVGVVNNLVTGTVAAVTSVAELVKGTVTLVPTVTTVSNLTNGSINILTGTIQSSGTTTGVGVVTSVTNLAAGTVQINPVPVPATLTHGTLGTAGGSFFATVSAASGAGTKHYVTGVDIVAQSGTADIRVLAGTAIQGTGVLAAGFFPAPGGGISNRFTPAFATGTNSEITYHFVGAGTAFIRVSYWKGT